MISWIHWTLLVVAVALCAGETAAAPWNVPSFPHPQPRQLSTRESASPPWEEYNQTTAWFDGARLDHFNNTSNATWSQRYFVIDDFWKSPTGPVRPL